ncbi:MAG TPA: DUF4838 domain-containing protein [Chthoniobacteraceae bacterium]|nr:DUF4838 domain-containing protein [Chthoniobacteraceae bacterium]
MKLFPNPETPFLALKVAAFGLLLAFSCPPALHADKKEAAPVFAVIEQGKPLCSIVIAPEATDEVRRAAALLQEYLQESTGATFAIEEGAPTAGKAIHVGRTAYVSGANLLPDDLGEQGFILQPHGGHYVICGGDDAGTRHGVLEFLERYVGVRWLWPGEEGTVIPVLRSLTVPMETVREEPSFLMRQVSPLDWNGETWRPLKEWGEANRVISTVAFHHNLYRIYDPKVFARENPEFYPMISGQRIIPNPTTDSRGYSWQPNFSAEGIVDAGAERIVEYFRKNPDANGYSLGINDSNGFDESPASKARRSGEKNALGREDVSDDYFAWANDVIAKVSKSYPDKIYGTLAYTSVFDPPKKVKVDRRIIPFLAYDRMQWLKPNLKQDDQARTERWSRAAANLGWYDYVYGAWYRLPRVYFNEMAEYLRWARNHNVRYYYAEAYPNWTGEGPKMWLMMKLLWNPDRDVDALLDDWCRHAVGAKAAPYLKAYFRNWETFWVEDAATSSWMVDGKTYCNFADPGYLAHVSPEFLAKSEGLLKQAADQPKSPEERDRMKLIEKMWLYYRDGVITYQAEERAKAHPPTTEAQVLTDLEKAAPVLDAAARRVERSHAFTNQEWSPNRFFFNTRWARPDDVNWGFSLLWNAREWLEKSDAIRQRVEAMAAETSSPASDYARVLLASTGSEGKELLANPVFADGLNAWRVVKRNEKLGSVRAVSGGVQVSGPTNSHLIQNIPWPEGLHYAVARFEVPAGRAAPSVAQVSFVPSKNLRTLVDFKYVLPTLNLSLTGAQPKPGESCEVVVPIRFPANDGSFQSLNVSTRIILSQPDEEIILQEIQLYKAPPPSPEVKPQTAASRHPSLP